MSLTIVKEGNKNFQHQDVNYSDYGANDLTIIFDGDMVKLRSVSGRIIFDKDGYVFSSITVVDNTNGGVSNVYASVVLLKQRLIDLGYAFSGETPQSYVFDLSFGTGALAANANWYSTSREVGTITQWIFSTGNYNGATNVISESRIVKIALPFNCRMKDLSWYHSTLQTAFTVRVIHGDLGSLNTINNQTIIAEQQFLTNSNQKKGLFTTIKNTALSMNKDSFVFVALFNNNISTGSLRNNHLQIEFEQI